MLPRIVVVGTVTHSTRFAGKGERERVGFSCGLSQWVECEIEAEMLGFERRGEGKEECRSDGRKGRGCRWGEGRRLLGREIGL